MPYTNMNEAIQAAEKAERSMKNNPFFQNFMNGGTNKNHHHHIPMPEKTTNKGGDAMDLSVAHEFWGECHYCHKYGHVKWNCPKCAYDNAEKNGNDWKQQPQLICCEDYCFPL